MRKRAWSAAAAGALVATGCLSTAPPAPPVRWFDPLPPEPAAAIQAPQSVAARVETAPHLGRDFVVRLSARELAFDADHRWLIEPRDAVAIALRRELGLAAAAERTFQVVVDDFELDRSGAAAAAVVRLRLTAPGVRPAVVEQRIAAAAGSPEAAAAAMATALQLAAGDVDRWLAEIGWRPAAR